MASDPHIYTVSELNSELKSLLEECFPLVAVLGEISNFRRAASGHCYFTLKDERSQLGSVIWKSTASRLKFECEDGLEVVAVGKLDVYVARGSYQLMIQEVIPQGIGPLELAFRQLYEKLEKEGLFDQARKRALPTFPQRIAIVTSSTGAAIHDMLQVLKRRWPCCSVLVLPVAVQGKNAAPQIVKAFTEIALLDDIDLVITGRGGGSLEDLWAFNEETVARAIFHCPVPVICAVGHETDVSIGRLRGRLQGTYSDRSGRTCSSQSKETFERVEEHQAKIG